MIKQTNLVRFRHARQANPAGVVFIALDRGHEIRIVMTDYEKFRHWMRREKNASALTIIVAVTHAPETSCYYGFEEFLAGEPIP